MSLLPLALTVVLGLASAQETVPLTTTPQAGDTAAIAGSAGAGTDVTTDTATAANVITVQETELDRRARELSARLRCPVCQSQSIEESNSTIAREMRAIVRERLAAGDSEDEIEQYFLERYGGSVLLDPRPEGVNLAVYILPAIALIAGIAIIIIAARKWLRPAGSASSAARAHNVGSIDASDPDLASWEEINR
jgi:cytochrome c-type biogenesis protein CcmH